MKIDQRILALGSLLTLLASCGSSGGGIVGAAILENEPNDSSATATALVVGESGLGTVADSTDSDWWQVDLTQGEVVSFEVFAYRLDQADWDAGPNDAKLTVLAGDGTTELVEQSVNDFPWNGDQDTDVLAFRAPAADTYYLKVEVDDPLNTGGDYLVSVQDKTFGAPIQLEAELAGTTGGNDTDATAETILPGTVYGFHVDDEVDWYKFTVSAPSLVRFAMNAHRNGVFAGDQYFDSEITLRDPALSALRSNDDTYYLDSSVEYAIDTPGDYFIVVGECCATGDAPYFLEFSMTTLASQNPTAEVEPNDSAGAAQLVPFDAWVSGTIAPGDDDFYAIPCSAGDRIQVQVFDVGTWESATGGVTVALEDDLANVLPVDNGGGLQLTRTVLTASGTFFVHVTSSDTTSYAFIVRATPATFESEPDDTVANAGSFDATRSAAGVIDVVSDADLFAFQAQKGVPVVFDCLADNDESPNGLSNEDGFGSQLDPELSVMDSVGTVLATSSCASSDAVGTADGLPTLSLVFVPPASGTYYVEVVDRNGAAGPDFYYVLRHR